MLATYEEDRKRIEELQRVIDETDGKLDEQRRLIGEQVEQDTGDLADSALQSALSGGVLEAETIAELLMQIRRINAAREDAQAQITLLQSAKRCEGCGVRVPQDALFCPNCGRRILKPSEAEAERNSHLCPQCGAAVEEGALFCTRCGYRLDTREEEQSAVTGMEDTAEITDEEIAELICPECGAHLEPDAVYCNVCGARVRKLES